MTKPANTLVAAVLTMMTMITMITEFSALCAPSSAVAQGLNLPDIGDSSFAALSKHGEDALGEAFMRSVRNSIPLMTDPIVEEYVQNLGYRLAAHSNNYYRSFYFFVVDSTQINAFAGPGGYIGINSGLILAAKSESEVAAVMAHEIGHVTQRHIARSIEMQKNMSIPSLAALLASMLLATQDSEAGGAAMAATLAGSAQYQINFIRRNEKEADRVGITTLAKSDFDPNAMPGFFEKLQNASRYSGYDAPEFLRTHPVTQSRIADSRNRAAQYPRKQYRSSLAFNLVRARIKYLSFKQPRSALNYFSAMLKKGQYLNRTAAVYGHALALAGTRQYQKARTKMEALLAKHPENIIFILGTAEIEISAGRPRKALPRLKQAVELYPGNLPLTEAYSDALMRTNQAAKARELLSRYIRNNGGQERIYKLLAHAEKQLGNRVAFHEALAEHYFLGGDTRGAITQLQLADKSKGLNYYE